MSNKTGRQYIRLAMGIMIIFLLGLAANYWLIPDEPVTLAKLAFLKPGKDRSGVESLLGKSLQKQQLEGDLMHWTLGPYPNVTGELIVCYMWSKPCGLVYAAPMLKEDDLTGDCSDWASTTLLVRVQFDESGHLVRFLLYPAKVDKQWSGTWWVRLQRRFDHWFK